MLKNIPYINKFLQFLQQSFHYMFNINSTIFWDITPYSPLRVNRRFGGTYRLHLQGRRISRARCQRESKWQAEHGVVRTSNPTFNLKFSIVCCRTLNAKQNFAYVERQQSFVFCLITRDLFSQILGSEFSYY
jgi:hypothetical protein